MCFSVLIIENRVFLIELWIPKPRCWLVGLVPGSCPIFDFWKNRWWCKFVNTPNSIFKKLDFNLYKARKRGYIQNRLKKSVCPIVLTHLWGTIKCPINKKDCFFSSRMDFINFWNLSPSSSLSRVGRGWVARPTAATHLGERRRKRRRKRRRRKRRTSRRQPAHKPPRPGMR